MDIKHPVSHLQELMARQHKDLPLYRIEDISTKGCPRYRCTVQADSVLGIGNAASKQIAKKDAAFHALTQLECSGTSRIINDEIITTSINYNAVGKLNEWTAQWQYPYPIYRECGLTGQGKFLIKCELLQYECEGSSSTKKIAKQVSAHFMLKLLEEKVVRINSRNEKGQHSLSDDALLNQLDKLALNNSEKFQEHSEKTLSEMSEELKALNVTYTVDVISRNPYVLVLKFHNDLNTTVVQSGGNYEIAYFNTLRSALELTSTWKDMKPLN